MAVVLSNDKLEELRRLRLVENKSVRAIVNITGISRGTVSKYCKGLRPNNPNYIDQRCATATHADKRSQYREEIKKNARLNWEYMKDDPYILSMIAFYWSEGSKRTKHRSHHFSFANSDPGAVKAVSQALKRLGYNDQRLYIKIMPEQDIIECSEAWEVAVGIRVSGCCVAKRRGESNRIWSRYGVCSLLVSKSSGLWLTIMEWIDCWRNELNVASSWQE